MTESRVLVTGAGGFIGSHLVEALTVAGARVTAMVHYNSENAIGNLRFLPSEIRRLVEIVAGDILDAEFVRRITADRDTVFHLGALIAIPHSYRAPRSFVETNITGTLNVIEAVRATGARLVHTSTSEVYGSARYCPMDEAHPLQAQSPYAATKIAADKMVEAYNAAFDIDCVTVRPFNTYGPRQSARAVIPAIIAQALTGADVIRLGALTPVRDMTFVSDTVAGFLAAANAADLKGGIYNLGTGTGQSIGDIATMVLQLMDSRARLELDPSRLRPASSEVDRLISSNAAFVEATGWRPGVRLEQGLRETVVFFQRHSEVLAETGYVL